MSEIDLNKDSDEENIIIDNENSIPGGEGVTININLLGYEVREEIEKSSSGLKISKPLVVSLALISISIIICVVSYIILVGLRDAEVETKEKLESRIAELNNKDKEFQSLIAERDVLKQKKDILNWAANNNFKWSALLEEIRERTPNNLWVEKIDISQSYQLSLSGTTFDHKTVALFLANLQDSPAFTDVKLAFTRKTPEIKLRSLETIKEEEAKSYVDDIETERMITSTTKFSISCKVVTEF